MIILIEIYFILKRWPQIFGLLHNHPIIETISFHSILQSPQSLLPKRFPSQSSIFPLCTTECWESQDLFGIILARENKSIKFPTHRGMGCIQGDSMASGSYHIMPKKDNISMRDSTIDIIDIRGDLHTQRGKSMEDMINVMLEGTT